MSPRGGVRGGDAPLGPPPGPFTQRFPVTGGIPISSHPGVTVTAVLPGTSSARVLSPGAGGRLFGSSQKPPGWGDVSGPSGASLAGRPPLCRLQTGRRTAESSPKERARGS